MTDDQNSAETQGMAKPLINLLRGWPNPELLPSTLIRQGAARALSDPDIYVPGLLYGPNLGDAQLRRNIAAWLTKFFTPGDAIKPERVAITGGASQNLGTLMQVYSDPGYTLNVWFVVPCYGAACRTMEDAGFASKLRSVPEDKQGIDTGYLEEELRKAEEEAEMSGNVKSMFKAKREARKSYRHIIFTVPTFSNPSSHVITLHRRKQLVRLARSFDALIICDDVYDFLQWPTSTTPRNSRFDKAFVPRLVDVDRFLDGGAERAGTDGFGNVASNSTFSKIAAPGLRTGWTEGTERFAFGLSQAGTTVSGGAPSNIVSVLISSILESGDLQRFILEELQPQYSRRYYLLHTAIDEHLVPLGCKFAQDKGTVAGGFFIWLQLPCGFCGDEVTSRVMEENNLIVAAGSMFEVAQDNTREGTSFRSYLRLCFAWEDEKRLLQGVERLSDTIRRMLRGSNQPIQDNATV